MPLMMNFGSQLGRRLLGISVLMGGVAAPVSAQWTVTNLHPEGATLSAATGISGDQQVGYAYDAAGNFHASLWSGSAASWVDLNPAEAFESQAFGVSSALQVGTAYLDLPVDSNHAALWSGTAASWVDLNPAGATESEAYGAGGDKQVGWANWPNIGGRAMLWSGSAASWVDLHPPYHSSSQALGISDDGQQQVGWADLEACLWSGSAASWVDLHPAGAVYVSQAVAVCGGQQVGKTFMGDGYHASLWNGTAASWVDLHPAGVDESFAYGVWCDGGVEGDCRQVGKVTVSGKDHASLWIGSASSWVDLHAFLPAGFFSSQAQSIWSDASFTYVVGSGFNTLTGRTEALLWKEAVAALCVGDVAGPDGVVNGADLATLLGAWGRCAPGPCPADLDGDGVVNGIDLALLLAAWGPCR
jgi:uncharacterized membrane protein